MKYLIFFAMGFMALNTFAAEKFSFAGHVTLKNDVPAQIQLTLFEGDFQQAPADEDTKSMTDSLAKLGTPLESDIFYSSKDGVANLIIMVVMKNGGQSVLIIDLEKRQQYDYNISEVAPGRIVSRHAGYSDYILEVK